MAKVTTINAKEMSSVVVGDLEIECRGATESFTVRLPSGMADKLKKLKKDMAMKGHILTYSDIIRSALTKVLGE